MSLLQLHTPLEVETPKGRATAHFLINPGREDHLQWVCFLHDNGQCWTFVNPDIRLCENQTMGTKSEGFSTSNK